MKLITLLLLAVSWVEAAPPANWVDHRNPKGFALKHPAGWVVETPAKDMVVIHDATGGVQAIAQGFMTRPEVTAQQWLQGMSNRFPDRFQKVALQAPVSRRAGQATVAMTYTSRWGDGRAMVLCSLNKGAGMMFAIAAPAFRFDEFSGTLIEILRTFTITQAPGGAAGQGNSAAPANPAAGLQWVRWQDPVERAFSLEIPQGWRMDGGMVRRSAVDVHGWVRVTSPEGIMIFSNDRDMTSFVVPTQTLGMSGFQEGSRYSPGYGTQMTVMRYQPGVVFAEQWARRVSGAPVQVRDRKQRDDLAQRMNALAQGGMAQINYSYGEVAFSTANGQAGYILAGTQLTQMQGAGMWFVETLVGFTAPPAKAAQANAVMAHMIQTYQVNPQWAGAQQQTTAQTSKIVAETSNYVSQVISQTYWNRQEVQDRAAQNYSDATRGIQVVVDPNTGQKYEAVAGHNYYYLPPGSTTTIASDVQAPPNIDLTELQPSRR